MSQLIVDDIVNRSEGAPGFSKGIVVTGICTASIGGNVTGNVTGTACTFVDGNFTGNVSIGGTLTYEDVTNIDSVGIITARSGLQVTSGQTLINTTDNGGDVEPPLIVSGRGNDATDSGMIRIKRGTAAASLTAGDSIGDITWTALDGGNAAQIAVKAGLGWAGTTDSPGQIIIKTTPDGSGTLADRITIDPGGDVTFGSFNSGSTTGYGAKIDIAANAAAVHAQCQDTASQYTELFAAYKGTTKPFHVIANGTVTCVTLTETSDIALKTDIEPITNVLDKIQQLTGYTYKFKDDGRDSMGVTAQDVEKVFPELVHGEDGNKSLQYSGLIGALIESVKELSAKVAALEANVD